jgi:hypothetical protein
MEKRRPRFTPWLSLCPKIGRNKSRHHKQDGTKDAAIEMSSNSNLNIRKYTSNLFLQQQTRGSSKFNPEKYQSFA